jgi:hypothetical protein
VIAAVVCMLLGATPAGATDGGAIPGFSTDASPSTTVGLAVFDHVNLLGGISPTGTITFKLYGPGDLACQTPVFASTVAAAASGSDDSSTFMTSVAGTYNWVATYSGDGNNNPVQSACGSASQAVIVSPATPVVTATASVSGGVIRPAAAIQWGFGSPTGTLTFYVTGPDDQFCSGTPVYTQTIPASGDGSYSSEPFTPTVAGTYTVRVRYSGDTNNFGVGPTGCITQGDAITLTQAQLAPITGGPPPTPSPPVTSPAPPPAPTPTPTPTPTPSQPPATPSQPPASSGQPPANPSASGAGASNPTPGNQPPAGASSPSAQGATASGGVSTTANSTAAGSKPLQSPAAAAAAARPALHGPTRCVRGRAAVYVTGGSIRRVTYRLGTRRLATVSKADAKGRFVATVSLRGLRRGSDHRLRATVTTATGARVLARELTLCG